MSISLSEMFTFSDWLQYRQQRDRQEATFSLQRCFGEKTNKFITVSYYAIKNNMFAADIQIDEKLGS